MRQPIFTPKLPDPTRRKPAPPRSNTPDSTGDSPQGQRKSPLSPADAAKTSGLSSTLLPKAALQPAMLLRPPTSAGKPRSANTPREVAEQFPERVPERPIEPTRQSGPLPESPADWEPTAAYAEEESPQPDAWTDDPRERETDWTHSAPPQTAAQPAPPRQARAAAGKGGIGELEASARADLLRIRAKALAYWETIEPKFRTLATGKHRRLKWAAGVALLLFVTPVGDHAWASLAGGLDQVGAETRTRAAFQYIEDFRQGILAEWDGDGLTIDDSGAARATELTLYKDTMELTDYFMDFDFALDRPSLGWVVRASGPDSYCSFEIQQTGTKKEPRYQFVRYPVTGGQPDEKQRVEVDITADYRASGRNRLSVRIRGNRVATFLNGRSVDFWTDKVLGKGGIGFWSDEGESAQIQRVAVYGNEDFWGLTLYAALEATNRVKQFFGGPAPVDSQSQAAF